MFSFIRLFGLASAGGRKRLLGRTPAEGLPRWPPTADAVTAQMAGHQVVSAYRRLRGCVLAIASRLAPLSAAEPVHHLRDFLTKLPGPVLDATANLSVLQGAADLGIGPAMRPPA
jgi:hypothetical protein